MKEVWKDVVGFEGIYIVSNFGHVKSLHKRKVKNKSKILSKSSKNKGYVIHSLCSNGETKYMTLHRIVAIAFIPNPENKPQINHIDGDKLNNRADNLEWCTSAENNKHAYKTGLSKVNRTGVGKFGKLHHNSVPIVQLDMFGNKIGEFDALMDAERATGISYKFISMVCLGKRNSARGFKWKYKSDYENGK
jgi:hypothetical protein